MSKLVEWCLPASVKIEICEKQTDIKYEWIVVGDGTDDDAADDTPIDDESNDVPDDATCNELCLCNASVLSTKIENTRKMTMYLRC